MTTALLAQPDAAVLDEFIGRMIGDLGATVSAGLVVLGDRLGLYKAMADGEPVTAEQLASRTGTAIAYVRPWLANQAAGGYLSYQPEFGTFSLSPEQAAALAIEDSPAFFAGAMQLVLGALRDLEHIEHGFRTGEGFGWHEHDPNLFEGTERFFRPGYATHLVESWLPALTGVVDEVADATELAPISYDLVAMFDCLHDMGDPASVARAVRGALREDGTLLLVEPFANDRLEENLNPIGRVFYGGSTLICTPCSLAQPGARALGPQAGPTVLTNLLRDAGFSRVRVASESPVNLIFEARP